MKLNLTKKQVEVLKNHLERDLSYGAGGTFVDIDSNADKIDIKDYKIAQTILKKLEL